MNFPDRHFYLAAQYYAPSRILPLLSISEPPRRSWLVDESRDVTGEMMSAERRVPPGREKVTHMRERTSTTAAFKSGKGICRRRNEATL